MTTCTAVERAAAIDAADQLRDEPKIAAVDVLPPTEGPRDQWSLEIVVPRSRVPPQVLLALGAHGLHVETVKPRGNPVHQTVVARV